jgi:aminoglycoside phosphotransferase (APT) family kinase protein
VRHLLVDAHGEAAAVIDWGDVCLGDPAVDLSLAYAGFAGQARAALLAAYGPVDAATEARARVLAVFLSAALAEYAVTEGRDRLFQEASTALRRAVSS